MMRDNRNYLPRMVNKIDIDQEENKQSQYFGNDALKLKEYTQTIPSDTTKTAVVVEIIAKLEEPETTDILDVIGITDRYYNDQLKQYEYIVTNYTNTNINVYISYFGKVKFSTRRLQ